MAQVILQYRRSREIPQLRRCRSQSKGKIVSISIPGTIQVLHVTEEEVDPPERTWICSFQNEGRPDVGCGADFPSYKALAMHQRRAHQLGLFLSRTVAYNS